MDKDINIFAEFVDGDALNQFYTAMKMDFSVKGALMPDVHKGYSLPIGAVVATKDVIVPSWVGYDIGCGMCSVKTNLRVDDLTDLKLLHEDLQKLIPVGNNVRDNDKAWLNWDKVLRPRTKEATNICYDRNGPYQLGTLGGGNHFLEIGYDEESTIWVTVHSGSRGVGHGIASHYMKVASGSEEAKEGHFALSVVSKEGQDYIKDMNFALEFALENRKVMMQDCLNLLAKHTGGCVKQELFINRNHNHAEIKDGLCIHRKGATHAELGMLGVIPGNMRDGVFIVCGKGNPDSLCSSSHGAGRVMGRYKAKKVLSLAKFEEDMKGVVATVSRNTLDEAPDAYKNIFDVMEQQKDLVSIVAYVKPLVSIKG